ncbi:MAG: hypothetical protein LBC96_01690 [Lachnospiraceae bacterium]|jgi:hypothetical protein|nr:hypothetical protein [Lachnospiraceae bacterium]
MSKYQSLRNAIKEFAPTGEDVPFLCSSTQVNEKAFKALLGRKLKPHPIHMITWLCIFLAGAAIVGITAFFNQTNPYTIVILVPVFIILFLNRSSLIAITDDGLRIYFFLSKLKNKNVIYDQVFLPFDKITELAVSKGVYNTDLSFLFDIEEKTHTITMSVPNIDKKMDEQAENLIRLMNVLEKHDNYRLVNTKKKKADK